jgi:DNA polymerase II small subunit/DNA polymerase delta subunit B
MDVPMELNSVFQIGQIIGMIVLATIFVVMIKSDVKVLKVQMGAISDNLKILNDSFSKLSDILSRSAVQDTRIARLEEDVREMRRGRGFIQQEVEGEYTTRGKIRS